MADTKGSDRDLSADLEDAADWANDTEAQPDWDELIAIDNDAAELRKAGKLDDQARASLLSRARDAIPVRKSCDYLMAEAKQTIG
jgi:hypothetical protein